jgi:hypothetical protein
MEAGCVEESTKYPGEWSYYTIDGPSSSFFCPYGQLNNRLWVRETWSSDFANHYPHDRIWYRADDDRSNDIEKRDGVRGIYSPESNEFVPFRWRPSIHMFRSASRIDLEINDVRVERLQEISAVDAIAEGITLHPNHYEKPNDSIYGPVLTYRDLWESINGVGSWDANPWVWVIGFKRCEQ